MSESDDARVRELTAELAEAKQTIAALVEQVDNLRTRAETADSAGQTIRQKTRALSESEAQLRSVNSELRQMEQAKAEFISVAAHELRTPLTGIVGYLDLIAEGRFGDVPQPLGRPVAALRRNAYRLKRLVEELLDITRIETGQVQLAPQPCELDRIAADVVEELMPLAVEKRQTMTAVARAQPTVFADPDKLHRALEGVVASTIRATPDEGVIHVTTDFPPQDSYTGEWGRVQVRNDGPGVSVEQLQRMFEPFVAARSVKHHTSSGPDPAGLGLYISRGLVELHDGMIMVDSHDGEYTELSVLLPLHTDAQA